MSILDFTPERKQNTSEELNQFIDEVASQAAIILMERHLSKRDLPENVIALQKYQLISQLKKLLNDHNQSLAFTLFSPAKVAPRGVSYYDAAARRLADVGEKLWKK